MTDQTSPNIMASQGSYDTLTIRGIGFAPSKKEWAVLPPGVTADNIAEFLSVQEVKTLGKTAIEHLQ